MTKIIWDAPGTRQFTIGVDRVVFYPQAGPGIAWNGVVSIKESVANQGQSVMYVDGQRQITQLNLGEFGATIEAFTYPDAMLPYDGYSDGKSGQRRKYFNLAYRTLKGSDTKGPDQGYRLHLVYNCILEPTARDNLSNGGNDSAMMFSWQLSTTPMAMPYDRPSSHFIIDSELVPTIVLSTIEDILYGTPVTLPAFLTIDGLLAIFDANATFVVVDNGDGTCTITGPDTAVYVDGGDSTLWHIDSEGVSILDAFSFFAHSY